MARNKILLVEDEPKVCELIKAYLVKDGDDVVIAGDGKTAIEQAQIYKPDLILLDLNLPELDGLEVCRQIRKQSNVPIIMLTARDEEIKLSGLRLGPMTTLPSRLAHVSWLPGSVPYCEDTGKA
jgi:DNA-binding response OmpR family regulator